MTTTHHVRYLPAIRRSQCSCGWRSHRFQPYFGAIRHLQTMHRWHGGRGEFVIEAWGDAPEFTIEPRTTPPPD